MMRTPLLLLCILISIVRLYGQRVTQDEYAKMMKDGEAFYHQGEYEKSESHYRNAAAAATTLFGEISWEAANAIWSLVYVYEALDDVTKTEDAFNTLRKVTQRLPDGTNENIIKLTEHAAGYLLQKGREQNAARLFKDAMKMRHQTGTATGEAYYWDVKNTMDYSYKIGKRDSIHYYFAELLTVIPEGHNTYASTVRDWMNFSISGKSTSVLDKVEKACDAYLRAKEQKNEKDSWYAETWITYAKLQEAKGQYERALNAYNEAKKVIQPNATAWGNQYLNLLSRMVDTHNDAKKYDPQTPALVLDLKNENDRVGKEDYDVYLSNLLTSYEFYKNTENYNEAELTLENGLAFIENKKGKNHEDYMNVSLIYGTVIAKTGHVEKLKSLPQYTTEFEQSLLKSSGLNDASKSIETLSTYLSSGQFLKATEYFEKWSGMMISYFAQNKDFETLALTHLSLGYCYKETGNLKKAEEMYLAARAVAYEKLGKTHFTTTTVMMSVGEFYQTTGAWKMAETYYYDAIDILNQIRETSDKAKNDEQYYMICSRLAHLYTGWNYYEGAENFYIKVLDYKRGLYKEQSIEVASAKYDLADLYRQMELYPLAERMMVECEPTFQKTYGENNIHYITFISSLASLYQQRGKYRQAEPLYVKCRNFYLNALGNKSERYISVVTDLAMMYFHMNQLEKAKEHFTILNDLMLYQADNFFPSLSEKEKTSFYNSTSRRFNIYNSFALRYAMMRPSEGGELYNLQLLTKGMLFKATNRMRETVLNSQDDSLKANYTRWIQAKNELSRVYRLSDKEKKSAGIDQRRLEMVSNDLEKKISKQSELFASLLAPRPGWKNIQQKLKPGEAAIEFVRIREAFPSYKYAFRGKGIAYDTLADGYARITEVLSDRCAGYKAGIGEGDTMLKINGTSTRGKTMTQIHELLGADQCNIELLRNGRKEDPYSVTVSSDSVYERIFTRKTIYAALILTGENTNYPQLVKLPEGDQMESRYIRYYQNSIRTKSEDKFSYNMFWAPVATHLSGISKIFVSPDGVYNSINLNTLRDPSTGKYVIDQFEVVIVNNTSDVLMPSVAGTAQQTVLVGFPDYYETPGGSNSVPTAQPADYSFLGSDTTQRFMSGSVITQLPGTKTEVNAIEEILKTLRMPVLKYTEQKATEERIKNISSPKILHIATHGFFLNDVSSAGDADSRTITAASERSLNENPLLRSGLLLAGAGKTIAGQKDEAMTEDGILTAYEAANLNLTQTELVVMSACETGLGQIRSGEGVYGLQRAFRAAGANNILMSLWKVDDQATQQLMKEFYSGWLKTGTKQTSFKEAQLKLRTQFPHPYYWGAFVMLGN